MSSRPRPRSDADDDSAPRRRYESPLRRAQAAATRERIVAAGSELAHEFPTWNWRGLTVRAVAERAGVNERTVYRYFPSERELRDAVMRRLEEEAGDPTEALELADLPAVTARVFEYLASFAMPPPAEREPTFADVDRRRSEALLAAVAQATPEWSDLDRRKATALLDVLWSLGAYQRLTTAWSLEPDEAAEVVTGLVRQVVAAVGAGRRPWRDD